MSVTTSVYRVPKKIVRKLEEEPDLVDALDEVEDHTLDELGLEAKPPSVEIDQHELLLFLKACGHSAVADALEEVDTIDSDSGIEIQLYSVTLVKKLAALAGAVDLGAAAGAAKASEDIEAFRERPDLAEAAVKQLRRLVPFLAAATKAGEAVVVTTS